MVRNRRRAALRSAPIAGWNASAAVMTEYGAAEMLARANANQLVYEPGKGWGYSNIGYFHVRQLIERPTRSPLGAALTDLVLKPLAIGRVRLASDRSDFSPRYDPKWVYHGLLVGPLDQAALLLERLLTGDLLPQPLRSAMLDRYRVDGPISGRPWKVPVMDLA